MAYRSGLTFGYGLTPWVQRLIIANVIIFIVTALGQIQVAHILGFVPAFILIRPWTLVTYMFLHGGWMHLLFNMLGLFFFGPPLEARWGSKRFLKYYFICGLGGAVLSSIMAIIQPSFAAYVPIIGASGAVYGVMLAFAMNWPDTPIYLMGIFPIPAKVLVALLAAFSLVSAFGGRMDGVAHFAHLGGFAAGFAWMKWEAYRGPKGMRKFKTMMNRRKLTVVPGGEETQTPSARSRPAPRDKVEAQLLDDLDKVLDKISSDGMASLTPAERRLLDEASKKYRQN
jgi:membrane associated rhomboid family serine protease